MELSPKSNQEQIQDDLVLLHRVYPNLNRAQLLEARKILTVILTWLCGFPAAGKRESSRGF